MNVRSFVTITSVVFVSVKLPERSHKASFLNCTLITLKVLSSVLWPAALNYKRRFPRSLSCYQ